MSFKIEGAKEVQRNMAALGERYGKAFAKAAVTGGKLVRSEAIQSIQDKSSGDSITRYREGGGSYSHTVSKPGDAPNTDTGRLVESVQVDVTPKEVFVGSTLKYAGHLEFGTTNMDERPWLLPALEARRRQIEQLFVNAAEPKVKK